MLGRIDVEVFVLPFLFVIEPGRWSARLRREVIGRDVLNLFSMRFSRPFFQWCCHHRTPDTAERKRFERTIYGQRLGWQIDRLFEVIVEFEQLLNRGSRFRRDQSPIGHPARFGFRFVGRRRGSIEDAAPVPALSLKWLRFRSRSRWQVLSPSQLLLVDNLGAGLWRWGVAFACDRVFGGQGRTFHCQIVIERCGFDAVLRFLCSHLR